MGYHRLLEPPKGKTQNIPTDLRRSVGTTRRARKADHSLESCFSVLPQAEVWPERRKTVSSLSENDDSLDVRELFEGRIDLIQDAIISADAWRTGGTAQAQRGSTWRGSRSLHVQGDLKIWSAGCRATRWASQNAIELGEVSRVAFTEGGSSKQELDGEGGHCGGWGDAIDREHDVDIVQGVRGLGEEDFHGIACCGRGCGNLGI